MSPFTAAHTVADFTARTGRCTVERLYGGREVVGFGFQGDNTLDVLYLEEVGLGVVCRGKLLDNRTFGKGNIIFIGRYNLVRIFLSGFFYHLEEGRFLLHSVDDECAAENFVTAVLGVDLRKTEYLGVG